MNSSLIAVRYAKALLIAGRDAGNLQVLREDMLLIEQVCLTEPLFMQVMNSPTVRRSSKLHVCRQIFEPHVSALAMRFIGTMLERQREHLLPDVVRSFKQLYNAEAHIKEAVLTTAVPVGSAHKESLERMLEPKDGGHARLACRVNPDIMGGFILDIDGDVYDASVSTALRHMEQALLQRHP